MDVEHKNFRYTLLRNLYLSTYYLEALSFFALILLSSKLYDVNKEVYFLSYLTTVWLPQSVKSSADEQDQASKNRIFHLENLRTELDILIIELWSSRTTLILSVIFVLIYIFSWGFLGYCVRETQSKKDVSLTTVLLLAVFAAIDIAASAGFVMVRMIMLCIRDNHFPRDMRIPSIKEEHDQFVAIAALRTAILQSSPGNMDIYVSIIIGFLTGLRVYSVICAFTFYNKVRKGEIKSSQSTKAKSVVYCTDNSSGRYSSSHLDEFFRRSAPYLPSESSRQHRGRYKERGTKERSERRHSSTNSTAITNDVEHIEREMKIQAADMPCEMQRKALHIASQACSIYSAEKLIAESIKQDFDTTFGPTWHCVVGRNWGTCITHSRECYIRILYKDLTILLYRSETNPV
ncbi:uncharacterized protein LOC141852516 [Brevipalpus obovatus]|uniref:uncharacterized protein LOC141852516 n=1 Tax=Brevipalpus obovatus TaxID=246614 RepID=UPI003D9EC0D7